MFRKYNHFMLYLEDTESDPECDGMLSHTLPSLL